MDFYDTFDENGVFISSEDEKDVHYKGLWHKVVRIWLYDAEGNIWLKKSKTTGKYDVLNEVHLLSQEGISRCFDRALFERTGLHLPATSTITAASTKKMTVTKHFTDDSEFRGNYFLCDYIADFNESVRFFIFDKDTESLIRCSANGIANLISNRSNQIIAYEYTEKDASEPKKIVISLSDIERNAYEDYFSKFSPVMKLVDTNAKKLAREKQEEAKLAKFRKNDDESHANDNEGTEVY